MSKFKIGDKVRIINYKRLHPYSFPIGTIGTVFGLYDNGVAIKVSGDIRTYPLLFENIEHTYCLEKRNLYEI